MRKKFLFILSLLFGLMFINSGLNVFLNHMPPPTDIPEDTMQMFASMMQIGWLMPLLGTVQVLGGILFIIPRFRALGAVIIFPVMTGIMLTHLTIAPEGLPVALLLFVILIWLIVENKEKYLPMIKKESEG
ncbi:MAG: DoxX family protein [Bacteroidota bacterium]